MGPHRARWLLPLALGLRMPPLGAHAPRAGKVPRSGLVGTAETARSGGGCRHTLRDLGDGDGQNLVLEFRVLRGQAAPRPPGLAALIGLQVDSLRTACTGATLAAPGAPRPRPVVFVNQPHAVEYGLVTSLAHPGGHLPGVAHVETESVVDKLLQMRKELVPDAPRLGFRFTPASLPAQRGRGPKRMPAATPAFGLQVQALEGRQSPEDLEQVFAAIAREPPHALGLGGEPLCIAHRAQLGARVPRAASLRSTGGVQGMAERGAWCRIRKTPASRSTVSPMTATRCGTARSPPPCRSSSR